VIGDDVATALLEFARAENATQIVLGVTRRGRWESFLGGESVEARVTRQSGPIDSHLVTHERAGRAGVALPATLGGLGRRRSWRERRWPSCSCRCSRCCCPC